MRVVFLVELPHLDLLLAEAAIDFGSVVCEEWVALEGEHVNDVEVVTAVTTAHNVALLVVPKFAKVANDFIIFVQRLLVLAGGDGEGKALHLLFLYVRLDRGPRLFRRDVRYFVQQIEVRRLYLLLLIIFPNDIFAVIVHALENLILQITVGESASATQH